MTDEKWTDADERVEECINQLESQINGVSVALVWAGRATATMSSTEIARIDAHAEAIGRLKGAMDQLVELSNRWRASPYIAPGETEDAPNPSTRDTDLLRARVDRVEKEIRTEMRSSWERIRHAEDRAGQAEGRLNLIEDTLRDMAAPGWRPSKDGKERRFSTLAEAEDAIVNWRRQGVAQDEATKEQTVPQEMLDKMTENFLNGLNDTWSPERNAERAAIKAWQDEVADAKTTKPGPTKCRATIAGDRAECVPCGLTWGTNDACTPACMWKLDRSAS